MVQIDMPMPETCSDCPCSYWIECGRDAGKIVCCAIEARLIHDRLTNGKMYSVQDCVVEEVFQGRPEKCPIVEEKSESYTANERGQTHGQE